MVALVARQRCKTSSGIHRGTRVTISFGIGDNSVEHVRRALEGGKDGAAILLFCLIERRLGGLLSMASLAGVEHRLRNRAGDEPEDVAWREQRAERSRGTTELTGHREIR